MAKRVRGYVKLQIPAGKATPAPPIGPALGQHGVAIMEFCKQYNERTQAMAGQIVPVLITVYEDRSFSFVTKTPPAADLLRRAAGVEKGSGRPNTASGRQSYRRSDTGDRRSQDARSECGRPGRRHQAGRGYRTQHGYRDPRLGSTVV